MIVLDTNVVSELMRATPATAVVAWLRNQPAGELVTTAITLAEIRYGIARLPESLRKADLRTASDELFAGFDRQVLPFDAAAAVAYGDITAARERAGTPINSLDAQIAGICRSVGASVATRNGKDFHGTGIGVLDPWHLGS